ncbi:MAG: hypothetical protein EBR51_00230 [Gammaproteobacteria bacterium]|nr:hypothetical protein [Gammaproteobacteria bacterium]
MIYALTEIFYIFQLRRLESAAAQSGFEKSAIRARRRPRRVCPEMSLARTRIFFVFFRQQVCLQRIFF